MATLIKLHTADDDADMLVNLDQVRYVIAVGKTTKISFGKQAVYSREDIKTILSFQEIKDLTEGK